MPNLDLLQSLILLFLTFFQASPSASAWDCNNNGGCGFLRNISYPFGWATQKGCGHPDFEIHCNSQIPYILIHNFRYRIVSYSHFKLRLAIGRQDLCNVSASILPDLTSSPFKLLPKTPSRYVVLCKKSPQCSNRPWKLVKEKCRRSFLTPFLRHCFRSSPAGETDQPCFDVVWDPSFEGLEVCQECYSEKGFCSSEDTNKNGIRVFECLFPYDVAGGSGNRPQNGKSEDGFTVNSAKSTKGSKSQAALLIGMLAGIGVLAALIITVAFRVFRLSRAMRLQNDDLDFSSSRNMINFIPSSLNLPSFSYKELEKATDFFDTKREIGGGGFGSVYLGKLSDGRTVAVKRLYRTNSRRMEQFANELRILSSLNHRSLVLLMGYCEYSTELLLVYEFAPNGTLADHLHGPKAPHRKTRLPWNTRLDIAIQIAEGLAHLHFSVKPPIFHRDITSSNILLCEDFRAKIADFGLSRLVMAEETDSVWTTPQGTPGYLDPDYYRCFRVSNKSDVYSFGVVLMELISAQKAMDVSRDKRYISLADLAVSKIQMGDLQALVDPFLEIDWNGGFESRNSLKKMVLGVAEIAFRCLAFEKDDRPDMREVVSQLKMIKQLGTGATTSQERS